MSIVLQKYMSIVKYLRYEALRKNMSKKETLVYACRCERCGHEWITRTKEIPIVCPKCKSPYWDRQGKGDKNGHENRRI